MKLLRSITGPISGLVVLTTAVGREPASRARKCH